MKNHIRLSLVILLILVYPLSAKSQLVHHWEALVLAENNWKYRLGDSEPPETWMQIDFNDDSWLTGPGGIGYGDGDDSTIIDSTASVYLRKQFNVIDSSVISFLYLYADYDDAFVAYLNGKEICRANIGIVGTPPAYNESTYQQHEAKLYRDGLPEDFMVNNSLLKSGNNVLAVQVQNNSKSSSDLSSIIFLMAGINDSSSFYQDVPDWFEAPSLSFNLPILVVNTEGQIIVDEPKITASLGIIDNGEGNLNYLSDNYNGYNGQIGIEIRGHSSRQFPKKSYGIETRLSDGSNNNVSLLGMPAENDWVLYAPYSDKSLMRNVLSYHIGQLTGEYTPRTRWCELFIDGDYKGLYVLTEKIKQDKNRVDISKLKNTDTSGVELTGGYIISIDRDEGPESGWTSPNYYHPYYEYRDPKGDELTQHQKSYIQNHISQFEELVDSAESSEEYSQYFDIPSFVNYWLATEIFKNLDNYKFSFFMYKTRDDKGGKIHFGPLWDINLGYGNYDVEGHGPEGWSYVWTRRDYLHPWIIDDLSADTLIQNQINCRWNELRQNSLRTDNLLNFIDTQALVIEEAQKRNFKKWPILGVYIWPNVFIGDTHEEELDYLKTWLSERLEWMDANMLGKCNTSQINDPSTETAYTYRLNQNYPNPFNPNTIISYSIPLADDVEIDIYDLSGNNISTIFRGYQEAGNYELNFHSENLSSGVYFYRIKTSKWLNTKKMVLIK